jgi:crotonobetainyl-CoA:carnitine CoA-transferase CaiB-like acyl-CoA transferase
MMTAGREDLANDPRLAHNDGRVAHEPLIDAALEEWARNHTYDELIAALEAADVPSGPIYNAADIVNDPHYQARGMFEDCDIGDGETVKLPTFVPKLSETPGGTSWIGPALGAHNQEVYGELLGMSAEEIAQLQADGVI